jgi:hypothetical protein
MQSVQAFLHRSGFRCLRLELVSTGDYSPRDSEWNYSDIPHLNYIHTRVDGSTIYSGKTIINSIFLQKIGPFTLPAAVTILHDKQSHHDYVMTILNLVICVNTQHEPHHAGCKTTTRYSFYYRNFIGRLLAVLARYATRKNYAVLMSEDMPMRDQRGKLRHRGIRFFYDQQELIGFEETNDIASDHVDASALHRGENTSTLLISNETGQAVVDDYLLNVSWDQRRVVVSPSICPHEGAPLPPPKAIGERAPIFACPWHGRRVQSLATFERGSPATISLQFCQQELAIELRPLSGPEKLKDELRIKLKNPEISR